jgi:glutamate--cysteine ligase
VIEDRDQLIAAMAKGEKPKERWRIGTEHEKLVYCTAPIITPRPMTNPAASATC